MSIFLHFCPISSSLFFHSISSVFFIFFSCRSQNTFLFSFTVLFFSCLNCLFYFLCFPLFPFLSLLASYQNLPSPHFTFQYPIYHHYIYKYIIYYCTISCTYVNVYSPSQFPSIFLFNISNPISCIKSINLLPSFPIVLSLLLLVLLFSSFLLLVLLFLY